MNPVVLDLAAFLRRARAAVDEGRVILSDYALEGADTLGWEPWDVRMQIRELAVDDWLRCEASTEVPGDMLWIFTPELWDNGYLWIRLVERNGIFVVSFHRG